MIHGAVVLSIVDTGGISCAFCEFLLVWLVGNFRKLCNSLEKKEDIANDIFTLEWSLSNKRKLPRGANATPKSKCRPHFIYILLFASVLYHITT